MTSTLYVGNLPRDANEALLRLAFTRRGCSVLDVEIPIDPHTGRRLGHATLTMASEQDAHLAAAALHGSDLDGRLLEVRVVEPEHP